MRKRPLFNAAPSFLLFSNRPQIGWGFSERLLTMAVIFLSLSHAAKFTMRGFSFLFRRRRAKRRYFLYILCNIIILYCNSNCYPLCVRIHGGIQVLIVKKTTKSILLCVYNKSKYNNNNVEIVFIVLCCCCVFAIYYYYYYRRSIICIWSKYYNNDAHHIWSPPAHSGLSAVWTFEGWKISLRISLRVKQ